MRAQETPAPFCVEFFFGKGKKSLKCRLQAGFSLKWAIKYDILKRGKAGFWQA